MIAIPAIEVPLNERPADRDDVLTLARELVRNGFSRLHVRHRADRLATGKLGLAARHSPLPAARVTPPRPTGRDASGLARAQEDIRSLLAERIADLQLEGTSGDHEAVRTWLDDGARWVLVDAATHDLDGVADLAHHCPNEIILVVEVLARRATVRVAKAVRERAVVDFVEEMSSMPLAGVLMRVGGSHEPPGATDLALIEDVVEVGAAPLLVASGAATVNDLRALEERGASGAVLDQTLLEGTLNLRLIAEEFAT